MKTLVFGGSGSIGRCYCKGRDVVSISSSDCDLFYYDKMLRWFKKNIKDEKNNILMLASVNKYTRNDESSYICNIEMAANLAYFVKEKSNRFIFISTVDVYGIGDKYDVSEETSCNPESLNWYAKSKYISEQIIQDLIPNSVILRLCGIYGTGTGLLDKNINLFNEGKNLRHFVHVEDLSEIFDIFLNNNLSGIFNIANPYFKMMREWKPEAQLVETKTERDFDLTFNTSKLKNIIGDYKWKY